MLFVWMFDSTYARYTISREEMVQGAYRYSCVADE